MLKSGTPHQSKAPPSEFKVCKSSDLKARAPHQSTALSSEFEGFLSYFKVSGAPPVQGFIPEVQG